MINMSLQEYFDAYKPKTSFQIGLAAVSVAGTALFVLRNLLKKKKDLKGKVVVITGASSGIGEGIWSYDISHLFSNHLFRIRHCVILLSHVS